MHSGIQMQEMNIKSVKFHTLLVLLEIRCDSCNQSLGTFIVPTLQILLRLNFVTPSTMSVSKLSKCIHGSERIQERVIPFLAHFEVDLMSR
jgi:hypothetical protein